MEILTKYLNTKENTKYIPVVLFEEPEESFFELVQSQIDKPLCFFYFKDCDWNQDFTPWPFEKFSGEGDKTLELVNSEIEKNRENLDNKLIAIGYSLGGLMALYYATKNQDVKYIASCSGSLWYPKTVEYLKKGLITDSIVYLSLGNKESKTKNQLMQTVDTKTLEVKELLDTNNEVFFEYNEGNHFFEVEKRITKGLSYLTSKI